MSEGRFSYVSISCSLLRRRRQVEAHPLCLSVSVVRYHFGKSTVSRTRNLPHRPCCLCPCISRPAGTGTADEYDPPFPPSDAKPRYGQEHCRLPPTAPWPPPYRTCPCRDRKSTR